MLVLSTVGQAEPTDKRFHLSYWNSFPARHKIRGVSLAGYTTTTTYKGSDKHPPRQRYNATTTLTSGSFNLLSPVCITASCLGPLPQEARCGRDCWMPASGFAHSILHTRCSALSLTAASAQASRTSFRHLKRCIKLSCKLVGPRYTASSFLQHRCAFAPAPPCPACQVSSRAWRLSGCTLPLHPHGTCLFHSCFHPSIASPLSCCIYLVQLKLLASAYHSWTSFTACHTIHSTNVTLHMPLPCLAAFSLSVL